MTDFDMKLPGPVLTFKLLDEANLSDDDGKLALELGNNTKFENVKSALVVVVVVVVLVVVVEVVYFSLKPIHLQFFL